MSELNLSPEEKIVYELIKNSPNRITQLDIARHEKYLGCLEKFEGHLDIDKSASTLRKIRFLIRSLRIKHNLPVLSDKNGYWILRDVSEAQEFVTRLEKTARSQARAWMLTFSVMKKNFNIESKYFEEPPNKIKVREHTRRLSKPTSSSKGIIQDKLF